MEECVSSAEILNKSNRQKGTESKLNKISEIAHLVKE